jgi:hypothetical protein
MDHATFSQRFEHGIASSLLWALCASVVWGCGRVSGEHGGGSTAAGGTADSDIAGSGLGSGAAAGVGAGAAAGDSSAALGGNGGVAAGGQPAQGGAGGGLAADCGARIDDMEDGRGRICTPSDRVGVWYSFNDRGQAGVQWPAETTPGTPTETSLIPGGRGASTRAIHTYGSGYRYWGAGVGIDLNFDGTSYRTYDASRYQGVHFWARSSRANQTINFRIGTASTTAIKYGGTCGNKAEAECPGPRPVTLGLAAEWREFTVPFGDLQIAGQRDRLTNIQFMSRYDFDFWIDDLSFVDGAPNCCPDLPACQGGVHFADASVRSAVLVATDASGVVACDRACDILDLSFSDSPQLESLGGFECLGGLETLTVIGSEISDPSPVSQLKSLRKLILRNDPIADLGAPFQLPNVVELEISGSQVSDVSALAGLTTLTALDLSRNRVTDTKPLSALTQLTTLVLSSNQIADWGPVSGLTALETLNLDNNLLADVGGIASSGSLVELNLSNNSIHALSSSLSFSKLESLDLTSNQLSDIPEAMLTSPNLHWVMLSHNQLHDLSVFAHSTVSNSLFLADNQIEDLSPLIGATTLSAQVNLTGNPFSCTAQSSILKTLYNQGTSIISGCL